MVRRVRLARRGPTRVPLCDDDCECGPWWGSGVAAGVIGAAVSALLAPGLARAGRVIADAVFGEEESVVEVGDDVTTSVVAEVLARLADAGDDEEGD